MSALQAAAEVINNATTWGYFPYDQNIDGLALAIIRDGKEEGLVVVYSSKLPAKIGPTLSWQEYPGCQVGNSLYAMVETVQRVAQNGGKTHLTDADLIEVKEVAKSWLRF